MSTPSLFEGDGSTRSLYEISDPNPPAFISKNITSNVLVLAGKIMLVHNPVISEGVTVTVQDDGEIYEL